MPTGRQKEFTDPFADLNTHENDKNSMDELLTPLNSDVTAAQYLNDEEDLSTCLSSDGTDDANWWESCEQMLFWTIVKLKDQL